MAHADFQNELYLGGFAGTPAPWPTDAAALEAAASEAMSSVARGYVLGSAGQERTAAANRAAFARWPIVPRMLRDVAERDLRLELLGAALGAPVLLAPIGVLGIVHPEAELAVARAAAATGVGLVLSTASSTTLEDVAGALGEAPGFFQLYWPKNPALADSLLGRAAAAGYRAGIVTLDCPTMGWRPRDLDAGYLPFLHGDGIANYTADPVFRSLLSQPPEEDPTQAVLQFVHQFGDLSRQWSDLAALVSRSPLPLLVKGVLHPEDARAAVDAGVAGVVVSNHGGRQVDNAIAALDALPGVVAAVGDRVPVLFDSGVRTGADVAVALALGARAVLLGRPYVCGLALGGTAGVVHVVRGLLAEFDLTLALSGVASLAALRTGDVLRRRAD